MPPAPAPRIGTGLLQIRLNGQEIRTYGHPDDRCTEARTGEMYIGQEFKTARRYPADYQETGRIGNTDIPGSAGQWSNHTLSGRSAQVVSTAFADLKSSRMGSSRAGTAI